MRGIIDDSNRQAVPRCLDYSTACSLGLQRLIRKREKDYRKVGISSQSITEWKKSPDIDTAVDLLAEALIVKNFESEEAIKAAKYILSKAPASSKLIRELSNHFLEPTSSDKIISNQITPIDVSYANVARLKKSVRMYQLNPIAWSDLSLCYATLGQDEKARLAMRVALNLGRTNRFILRSAARCYMHLKDPEKAVSILHRSGLCQFDPWIASAEIAISESSGLKSKCIGKVKHIVKDDNLTHFSRSELAAGIGTLELKGGSTKRAKIFMRQAINDPTENALAQAEWIASQIGIDIPKIIQLGDIVPASYEMQTRYQYQKKQFVESLKAAKMWGKFQQLSSRPIIVSTFLAGVCLDDDEEALSIIEQLLPAQRNHPGIINNYAFSLIRIGKVEDAVKELKKLEKYELSDRQKFVNDATKGLISFRTEKADKGRELYSKAVTGFERANDLDSAAIAAYFWALEEKRIGSQFAESRIKDAKSRINRYKVIALEELAKKM